MSSLRPEVLKLMTGANRGECDLVSQALREGADVNSVDVGGRTALMRAADDGYVEVIRMLLSKGAGVNILDLEGRTALAYAVGRSGSAEAVQILLNAGGVFDLERIDWSTVGQAAFHKERDGHPAIKQVVLEHRRKSGVVFERTTKSDKESILEAVSNGNLRKVAELLLNNPGLLGCSDRNDCGLTHHAARNGHIELLEFLLKHGMDVDAKEPWFPRSPLQEASMAGQVKAVVFLIKHCADVNRQNRLGDTALHLAAMRGHHSVAEILLNAGADMSKQDIGGRTPLDSAIRYTKPDIAELLRARGATERGGIFTASESGDIPKLRDLLRQDPSLANAVENPQTLNTPLHLAVDNGRIDAIAMLLQAGASPSPRSKFGDTPLHIACRWQNPAMAEMLVANGADINGDPQHETPLHVAAKNSCISQVKLLLKHGANVNAEDLFKATPLHNAHNDETVEMLISNGANVNAVGGVDERTPLHVAAILRYSSVVKLLLLHGANPNARDKWGRSALHVVCFADKGATRIVRLLLKYGADLDAKDKDQLTQLPQHNVCFY